MAHAWLDSLSEDWVSQPPSEGSSSICLPPLKAQPLGRLAHPRNSPGSKIPRPSKAEALSAAGTRENSAQILSERSANDVNIRGVSSRTPSKLSRELKFSRLAPSDGRSVSITSTNSVVHNTVDHRTGNPAAAAKTETPEWKRRLIYGDLAYGEQRDLFCSAGTGLENIFKPPQPIEEMVDGSRAYPSSPPLCQKFLTPDPNEDSNSDGDASDQIDNSPSPSPRKPLQMRYRLTEDESMSQTTSPDESIQPHPQPQTQPQYNFPQHQQPKQQNPTQKPSLSISVPGTMSLGVPSVDQSRKASGQSDMRNEDFSRISLERHVSGDGKVDFAPAVKPDQLIQRLERLRINQMVFNNNKQLRESDFAARFEDGSLDSAEAYERAGGFVNARRGVGSADGSFMRGMLSSVLDTSEMLPEDSLQFSTPKQFPTIRIDDASSLRDKQASFAPSPPLPPVPNPSPQKSSSGSPLKLFGPYDTFTNQTLMRRISQFEDQASPSSSRDPGSEDDRSPSDLSSALGISRPAMQRPESGSNRSRSVSLFGKGDLDRYEFSTDLSHGGFGDSGLDGDKENISPVELTTPRILDYRLDVGGNSSPAGQQQPLVVQRLRQGAESETPGPRASPMDRSAEKMAEDTQKSLLMATPRRNEPGSDTKRSRPSPSKDPTPKRRRTLHKSDIAYGREDSFRESALQSHIQMQAIMGGHGKDSRTSNDARVADAVILATRRILKPSTPSPGHKAADRRMGHQSSAPTTGGKSSPARRKGGGVPAAHVDSSGGGGYRKPSIRTQDFLDEAGKIMAMIRNQVRPAGLASLEESEAENSPSPTLEEVSFQDSTEEPFSRPPSRDGRPIPRIIRQQEDPDLIDRLRKYQELSDMGDIITSSIRSMGLAKDAIRAAQEVEQQIQSGTWSRAPLGELAPGETFSDPPNIRITENPLLQSQGSADKTGDLGSHSSSQSTNSTAHTGSSRASETRKTIAPHSVSHLIPDQVGSMYLDRRNKIWVKKRAASSRHGERNVLPSEDSEDDPLGHIPDLSVDATVEMHQLQLASPAKADFDLTMGMHDTEQLGSPTPSATSRNTSPRNYVTLSPNAALTRDMLARAKVELEWRQVEGRNMGLAGTNEDEEDTEHEFSINQDQGQQNISSVTPSPSPRRRNLTISFSSPIASIIQDVVAEDLDSMEDDPDHGSAGMKPPSQSDRAYDARYQSLSKSLRRQVLSRPRGGLRTASRHISLGGQAFMPRPVSRVDEREEEDEDGSGGGGSRGGSRGEDGSRDDGAAANRQISLIGDASLVIHGHSRPSGGGLGLGLLNTPGKQALASINPDASAILANNVGMLSLSPLSDFTAQNNDQSLGFEVSYVHGGQHIVSGDATKRVMSTTIRDLVDRLSEVEPYEPYWEDIPELDLHDKRLSSLHSLDEFCGRLVSLDASENLLSHLEGVPRTVRELKASTNMLSELTSWDRLLNLQYLDISNNEVKSLSGLSQLVHLRSLRADNNRLTNLDGLFMHDGLLSLRARDNELCEVDFEFSKLQRLAELDLGGNRIRSITGVSHLPALTILKLQKNELEIFDTAVVGEEGHAGLRYIDVTDNQLRRLDVGRLPSLHVLHADRNRIVEIAGLGRARHLDSLSVREQQGDAPLDVSSLLAAYEVRKLFLSGNRIGDKGFEPKVDLLNLQLLELANCGLQTLPPSLGQLMPNLRILNVNFNALTDLSPLRFIPRLKKLLAAGNRLANSTEVTSLLTDFPHLTRLDLRDNPVTQGFYPPMRVLVPIDGRPLSVDPFTLPDADGAREELFASRLDATTRIRRRLYWVVLAASCRRLRSIDGLVVDRATVLGRDEDWRELVREGLLPPEQEAPEQGQNGTTRRRAKGEDKGSNGELVDWSGAGISSGDDVPNDRHDTTAAAAAAAG